MLKNYTSAVPAGRSISFIELQLAKNGARDIMKRYVDQKVIAIMFIIPINGIDIPFKLPARIDQCENILLANLSPRAQPSTKKKVPEQAERTAWKILSDWVEAQMAMIELAQVEIMEIFLPYVYNSASQKTYFELLKEKNYKGLLTNG